MTVFSLVHGGQQGAWCFEPLIAELTRRGHRALAVDLPISDPAAGASEYADVVVGSLAEVDEEVIVAGHSLGGLAIPLVALRRPVARLAFICAAIPIPATSLDGVIAEDAASPAHAPGFLDDGQRWHLTSRDEARDSFFHDCPPTIQEWALDRQRPQCETPHREISPVRRWPDTESVVVNGTLDRCISLARARRTTRQIFGASPVVIKEGHFPFLTNPVLVADGLSGLANGVGRPWPLVHPLPRYTAAVSAERKETGRGCN
jgi:pimeloyl-ACP methyl ester carboxylesterase